MVSHERRRYQDSGPRRVQSERRISIDPGYNGTERRNGKDRRTIIDRRR